ncbi:hypothetical protein IB230_06860 [Pseudoxanthomonas sp. PXM01]|nr:hypothetical protein [Pseudoxanthomonas sp. PXM01]
MRDAAQAGTSQVPASVRAFRVLSRLLVACVLTSIPMHLALLMSDSAMYRGWVYLQMALLTASAWLLWRARKLDGRAVIALPLTTIPAIHINATYLNYGNGPLAWSLPLALGLCYVALYVTARAGTTRQPGASAAE